MKNIGVAIACSGLLLTTAVGARASERTIAIGGNLSASHMDLRVDGAPTMRATQIGGTPTLDVLTAGGLTLGISAQFARSSYENMRATYVQPAAQVGYFVPIGEYAAFWPIARAGYGFSWTRHELPTGVSETSTRTLELSLIPQVLLMPTKSFFVRFAPGMVSYRSTTLDARGGGGILGFGPTFGLGVGVML